MLGDGYFERAQADHAASNLAPNTIALRGTFSRVGEGIFAPVFSGDSNLAKNRMALPRRGWRFEPLLRRGGLSDANFAGRRGAVGVSAANRFDLGFDELLNLPRGAADEFRRFHHPLEVERWEGRVALDSVD